MREGAISRAAFRLIARSASAALTATLTGIWSCLRVADDDPPAEIVKIEPRGTSSSRGRSTGYALTLRILHPGILHTRLDTACKEAAAGADGGLSPSTTNVQMEVL